MNKKIPIHCIDAKHCCFNGCKLNKAVARSIGCTRNSSKSNWSWSFVSNIYIFFFWKKKTKRIELDYVLNVKFKKINSPASRKKFLHLHAIEFWWNIANINGTSMLFWRLGTIVSLFIDIWLFEHFKFKMQNRDTNSKFKNSKNVNKKS